MRINEEFKPNWASSPGETINSVIKQRKLSISQFQDLMDMSTSNVNSLLRGNIVIDDELAKKISNVCGASTKFWKKRDEQYREDLARQKQEIEESKEWFSCLPYLDLVRFGWVSKKNSLDDKIKECLRYFDVSSIDEWANNYNDLIHETSFRISSSYDSKTESVIAWLRQGLIQSEKLECHDWSPAKFQKTLQEVKVLSRVKKPKIFIPLLKEAFCKAGVSLIIAPTPKYCAASGATYFINNNKAMVLMSFRFRADDHFWFSLFHEAGHLLLHNDSGLFIDNFNNKNDLETTDKKEIEANEFAANILIPSEHRDEFINLDLKDWKKMVRFAKKLNISPGIVVGQLQYLGKIRHKHFNRLKNRYKLSEIHEV